MADRPETRPRRFREGRAAAASARCGCPTPSSGRSPAAHRSTARLNRCAQALRAVGGLCSKPPRTAWPVARGTNGPWRAARPTKALFESKPAIRQLPNRRQLVVHNVSSIQRVRIMDYNPKLAVRLRPDERGDGGTLFQYLRRGIFHWIHL